MHVQPVASARGIFRLLYSQSGRFRMYDEQTAKHAMMLAYLKYRLQYRSLEPTMFTERKTHESTDFEWKPACGR